VVGHIYWECPLRYGRGVAHRSCAPGEASRLQSITPAASALRVQSTIVRGPASECAGYFCGVEQHSPALRKKQPESERNKRASKATGRRACLSRSANRSRPKQLAVRQVQTQQSATPQRSRQHDGAPAPPPTARWTTHRGARHRDFGGTSCGALSAKPCANSVCPFTSSIGIEKLGDRKLK
jgi:hypothetical protein